MTETKEPLPIFVGTKAVRAVAYTRQAYVDLRGWKLPEDENGDDDGYLVEYLDGGAPNVEGFAGYVSWSPKEVFERAYKQIPEGTAVTKQAILDKVKAVNFVLLPGGRVTICEITLANGFTVRGESAVVDPRNYKQELGEQYAYEDALEKIWPLEGYLLREALHVAGLV